MKAYRSSHGLDRHEVLSFSATLSEDATGFGGDAEQRSDFALCAFADLGCYACWLAIAFKKRILNTDSIIASLDWSLQIALFTKMHVHFQVAHVALHVMSSCWAFFGSCEQDVSFDD